MQILRRSMQMSTRTGAQAAGLVAGVNISALQLRTNGFVGQVADLLAETGMPPQQFVAEITESVLIEDDDPAVPHPFGLAELGLVIAVDDFGTGYSSLGYLSRLPVRMLKLDRSITRRLAEPRGLAIARCVSDMAGSSGSTWWPRASRRRRPRPRPPVRRRLRPGLAVQPSGHRNGSPSSSATRGWPWESRSNTALTGARRTVACLTRAVVTSPRIATGTCGQLGRDHARRVGAAQVRRWAMPFPTGAGGRSAR